MNNSLMDILEILNNTALFSELRSSDLEKIKKLTCIKKLKKNEELFMEGEVADTFFVVAEGSLKVYKISEEGKEQTLHIQKQGDLVAEAVIFDQQRYPAFCKALKQSTVFMISTKEFLAFLATQPDLYPKLLKSYSKRLRQLVSLVDDLSLKDLGQRLVKYFQDNSKLVNKKRLCTINISKKELASFLGTTPEALSRAILSLSQYNMINIIDKKTFEVI